MLLPSFRRSTFAIAFVAMLVVTSFFARPASAACVYHNIGYDCEQMGYIMYTSDSWCDPESYVYSAPPPYDGYCG
jgi:hypothetical protein